MKELINYNELGLPISTKWQKSVAKTIKKIFGIEKLNQFYNSIEKDKGAKIFCEEVIEKIGITIELNGEEINKCIKDKGAFIAVCNYPNGGVDGLAMLATLLKYREDVKLIGNYILKKIEPISNNVIEIDNSIGSKKNIISGLKESLEHLQKGGGLIIFPAKKVSTYGEVIGRVEESEWDKRVIKLIQKSNVPIIPISIGGNNSTKYHILNKINSKLGDARLIKEIFNKKGETIDIILGREIKPEQIRTITKTEDIETLLKAKLKILNITEQERRISIGEQSDKSTPNKKERINNCQYLEGKIEYSFNKEISKEINTLTKGNKIFSYKDFDFFITNKENRTNSTKYIEEFLCSALSNNDNKEDTKAGKEHNYYLICFDKSNDKLVAVAEVGLGKEILSEKGVIDEFYSYKYFEFSRKFIPTLRETAEIGRRTIDTEYTSAERVRRLLWRAEIEMIHKLPGVNNIITTLGVCSSSSNTAINLVTSEITLNNFERRYRKELEARNSISTINNGGLDRKTINRINDLNQLREIIKDADQTINLYTPILNYYISKGAKVIAMYKTEENNTKSAYALVMINKESTRAKSDQLFHVEQTI